MRTRSLTEVVVSINDYDDAKHVEVCALSVTEEARTDEAASFGLVSEEEIDAADRYVAGILSRLFVRAYPWLHFEAQAHGCRPRWYAADWEGGEPHAPDACSLGGSGLALADEPPGLYLTVPRRASKLWLGRLQTWLAEIAASEAAP